MNDSSSVPSDLSSEEMAEYLRLYLDETGEHLDALVETLLVLEADPTSTKGLNEAFRLIHSIKGSSALLGLDRITALTHHLETHFERLRSGRRQLDTITMNVVLQCIDFLRECNQHLRQGQAIASAGALLDQVKSLESTTEPAATSRPPQPPEAAGAGPAGDAVTPAARPPKASSAPKWRIDVQFRAGLALAEMKAALILTRLAAVGTIVDSEPPRESIDEHVGLRGIAIILASAADRAAIEQTAHVEGVETVTLTSVDEDGEVAPLDPLRGSEPRADEIPSSKTPDDEAPPVAAQEPSGAAPAPPAQAAVLTETVRVDVDRLDVLLSLTGELVINQARLAQLAGEMAPAFKKTGLLGRTQSVAESLRDLLHHLGARGGAAGRDMQALQEHLASFEEQAQLWSANQRAFGELAAAIDQLTRVSNSLQHGVLNTRMVPVGPLFNRFKRSVRDVAHELGKRVRLELTGEKTEIDKRMIDEIGDPLNHLIRNCIDHGIEPADVRLGRDKPEVATVRLSAAHRGNNVFITVEDDGGGIDTQRVRAIARSRDLISAETADALGESELIDLIFEPGFSTAAHVSDISGRGVGMDIVRTRIGALNGTIEVDSRPGQGTRFTIRLPLTLTITRCMLFRLPHGVLAVPVENMREVMTAAAHATAKIVGRQLCDIRGELLPLVSIDDLFTWPHGPVDTGPMPHVVVLHANNRSFGLRVDELLGRQDMVVKPLDENFIHIRGLGGASILGDGTICLLLDVAACVDLFRRGVDTPPPAAP